MTYQLFWKSKALLGLKPSLVKKKSLYIYMCAKKQCTNVRSSACDFFEQKALLERINSESHILVPQYKSSLIPTSVTGISFQSTFQRTSYLVNLRLPALMLSRVFDGAPFWGSRRAEKLSFNADITSIQSVYFLFSVDMVLLSQVFI
jgi:hypothetical protein